MTDRAWRLFFTIVGVFTLAYCALAGYVLFHSIARVW